MYLNQLYGRVSPGELADLYNETCNFMYNPSTLVDVVFNKAEDLLDYSQLANNSYSLNQIVAIRYNILNKIGNFKDGIKEWNWRLS